MKRNLIIFILVFYIVSLQMVFSEKRVALVIGNSNYESMGRLLNPKNDATDVAKALERLNFEVILLIDGNRRGMNDAINSFEDLIKNSDIAIFFYSGHGVQADGENYLIPLGETFEKENDLQDYAINMRIVSNRMSEAKNKILILDACRDNPLPKRTRSGSKGLAATISNSTNTIIVFATDPGYVALDGTGKNSPFTESLLSHINKKEHFSEIFIDIKEDVSNKTNRKQNPWVSASAGRIYLAGKPTGVKETPTTIIQQTNMASTNVNKNIEYDQVLNFIRGFALVKLNNKWGIINENGKEIIPPKYDDVNVFSNGFAQVKLNNKWGFVDINGREITDIKYDSVDNFKYGYSGVKLNGKWGIINELGREVVPIKYEAVGDCNNGEARVRINGVWTSISVY